MIGTHYLMVYFFEYVTLFKLKGIFLLRSPIPKDLNQLYYRVSTVPRPRRGVKRVERSINVLSSSLRLVMGCWVQGFLYI